MPKIAAAQFAPAYMDLEGSLEKAVNLIAQARADGIDMIVFPETWMTCYPDFVWAVMPGNASDDIDALYKRLFDNAVDLSRDQLAPVRKAAKEHGVVVVLGINERASEMSAGTLYNTSVVIDATGDILNVHRKLIPTNAERTVWGFGDGRGLNVVETAVGRVGVLQCWENFMPLARTAIYAQNVEIYCAPTGDYRENWLASMQHIGRESSAFVVSVAPAVQGSDIPLDLPCRDQIAPPDDDWISPGNGIICSPLGEILAGPMRAEKGFLSADINLEDVRTARRSFDVVGHYSRPEVLQLKVNKSAMNPVEFG
ncbi:MAG: carbon-nitrogen hydrolase family protein [Rhodobacteraceae bacterium]|nr:carbon-nitrogen hydrolase family protein [Paracoccaceae bacterium]